MTRKMTKSSMIPAVVSDRKRRQHANQSNQYVNVDVFNVGVSILRQKNIDYLHNQSEYPETNQLFPWTRLTLQWLLTWTSQIKGKEKFVVLVGTWGLRDFVTNTTDQTERRMSLALHVLWVIPLWRGSANTSHQYFFSALVNRKNLSLGEARRE